MKERRAPRAALVVMRSAIAGGLAAVFEGRSHMHRTLQLPWRTPRKRTKLPSAELSNQQSGRLFAQGSDTIA
jgi:hypothetical protein